MSPSSPVSVGILPSNRTLEVGASHLDSPKVVPRSKSGQFPVTDDPFTDIVSKVGIQRSNLMEPLQDNGRL